MTNKIPWRAGSDRVPRPPWGGLLAGNSLLGDALTAADLLRLATAIEGHPDNAAPALLGGFVASARIGEAVEAVRLDVPTRASGGHLHPRSAAGDGGHATGPAGTGARAPTRSPTSAASRSGSPGSRPGATTSSAT